MERWPMRSVDPGEESGTMQIMWRHSWKSPTKETLTEELTTASVRADIVDILPVIDDVQRRPQHPLIPGQPHPDQFVRQRQLISRGVGQKHFSIHIVRRLPVDNHNQESRTEKQNRTSSLYLQRGISSRFVMSPMLRRDSISWMIFLSANFL